jgi:hypothetical protein
MLSYILSRTLSTVLWGHQSTPLPHEVASNNRPISLLLALSKVCDKVVLNQFTEYLTERKLLSNHQSGNRKNHSTETLNVALTDTLLEAMDKKQISIVVFIDLSKAFDSIQHDILLKILRLGVSPAVHATIDNPEDIFFCLLDCLWCHESFRSYLTVRSQYVRIGTTTSTTAPLTNGIPQGSYSIFTLIVYIQFQNSVASNLTWTTPKSIFPFHYRFWTLLYQL